MENKTFKNIEFFNIPAKYFPQITKLDINGNKTIVIKDALPQQEWWVTICKWKIILCSICGREDCPETKRFEVCDDYFGSLFGNDGSGIGVGGGGSTDPGATGGGNGGGVTGGGSGGFTPPYDGPPLPPCPGTAWYRGEPVASLNGSYECNPIRPTVTTDTIKNPCDQADSLAKDVVLITLMDTLKNRADDINTNVESGYTFRDETNDSLSITSVKGIENEAGIFFKLYQPIDGFIHNHYTGLLSVFSPDDLWSMSLLFLEGKMTEKRNFNMILTTANNTNYLLKIEDTVKLNIFATNFVTKNLDDFNNIFKKDYKILPTNSNELNEKRFLQFIQRTEGGSGLKLFRGNNNFTQWTPIKVDNNNIVVESPCE